MAQLSADLLWDWKSGVSRVSSNNLIVPAKYMFSHIVRMYKGTKDERKRP